jgi:hypothetical protein
MFTCALQLSSAVATPNSSSSRAEQVLVVTLTSGGIDSVGAVVSVAIIVIVWIHEAAPTLLVAVQVMKV